MVKVTDKATSMGLAEKTVSPETRQERDTLMNTFIDHIKKVADAIDRVSLRIETVNQDMCNGDYDLFPIAKATLVNLRRDPEVFINNREQRIAALRQENERIGSKVAKLAIPDRRELAVLDEIEKALDLKPLEQGVKLLIEKKEEHRHALEEFGDKKNAKLWKGNMVRVEENDSRILKELFLVTPTWERDIYGWLHNDLPVEEKVRLMDVLHKKIEAAMKSLEENPHTQKVAAKIGEDAALRKLVSYRKVIALIQELNRLIITASTHPDWIGEALRIDEKGQREKITLDFIHDFAKVNKYIEEVAKLGYGSLAQRIKGREKLLLQNLDGWKIELQKDLAILINTANIRQRIIDPAITRLRQILADEIRTRNQELKKALAKIAIAVKERKAVIMNRGTILFEEVARIVRKELNRMKRVISRKARRFEAQWLEMKLEINRFMDSLDEPLIKISRLPDIIEIIKKEKLARGTERRLEAWLANPRTIRGGEGLIPAMGSNLTNQNLDIDMHMIRSVTVTRTDLETAKKIRDSVIVQHTKVRALLQDLGLIMRKYGIKERKRV